MYFEEIKNNNNNNKLKNENIINNKIPNEPNIFTLITVKIDEQFKFYAINKWKKKYIHFGIDETNAHNTASELNNLFDSKNPNTE